MRICVYEDPKDLGLHAAQVGAQKIRESLAKDPVVSIILATGASQFTMLEALLKMPNIDWSRVEMFHLDEYVGLDISHPASFRKYLKERVASKLPNLKAFHYINADEKDLDKEVKRVSELISKRKIAVAFIGIGENGHLAFNDPPANVETKDPYLVVTLDKACRLQQVGEGWFPSVEDVPAQAVTMSIHQILESDCIVCTVPDERKAPAVKMALTAPIEALYPCAYLRLHKNCYLMLDRPAASDVLAKA